MLSLVVQSQLKELTGESDSELSIQKLIMDYVESKLSYWTLVDKQFKEKKGMSFLEYQNTKFEDWDGTNWKLKEEFLDWESAIASIQYFSKLRDKWSLVNSK